MTTPETLQNAFVANILNTWMAEDVNYFAVPGPPNDAEDPEPVAIRAVVNRGDDRAQYITEGETSYATAEVTISTLPTVGIPAPEKGAQVEFDGFRWTVSDFPQSEAIDKTATLRVVRQIITERSRKDYRS